MGSVAYKKNISYVQEVHGTLYAQHSLMVTLSNAGVNKSVTITPARDPEEDISIILQDRNVESSHLVI